MWLTTFVSKSIVVQLETHPVMYLVVCQRDMILDEFERVGGSEGVGTWALANEPTNGPANQPIHDSSKPTYLEDLIPLL